MDFKEPLSKLIIVAGVLALTLLIFFSLQHYRVYHYSLGLISKNYEHLENGDIIQKKTPYVAITNDKLLHWDAAHYQNIRDNAYAVHQPFGEACYAFFPLFPWLWKVTQLDAIGISLFNYVLFALSLLILSSIFLPTGMPRKQRLIIYTLALLLPGTVVFSIPYTESTFLFSFSVACYFLKKNIWWMATVFLILFAFTRPAITIIMVSMICTDVYFAFTGRNSYVKPWKMALRIFPLLAGTFLALYVQYCYSGYWFKVFEVQHNWGYHDFHIPVKLTDWSEEGYGMSVFTLIGVFIPVLIYLISTFIKKFSITPHKYSKDETFAAYKGYLFTWSLFYLAGITLFTLFFRGGSLNGLQRYALATPFFYIVFFSLPNILAKMNLRRRYWILALIVVGGTAFFMINGYSRGFAFAHNGFYLLCLCLGYLMFIEPLTNKRNIIWPLVLIALLLVWKTYLFNMFLCDGWIFT